MLQIILRWFKKKVCSIIDQEKSTEKNIEIEKTLREELENLTRIRKSSKL